MSSTKLSVDRWSLAGNFVDAQAGPHRQRGDDPHLRSDGAMVKYHIHASDGGIGHLDGLIIDDETWSVRYLVVTPALVGEPLGPGCAGVDRRHQLVEATVSVALTRQDVKLAPAYDPDALPDREQETRLHDHHGRAGYWRPARAGRPRR